MRVESLSHTVDQTLALFDAVQSQHNFFFGGRRVNSRRNHRAIGFGSFQPLEIHVVEG